MKVANIGIWPDRHTLEGPVRKKYIFTAQLANNQGVLEREMLILQRCLGVNITVLMILYAQCLLETMCSK